ncbi:BnaCnng22960D [Brassica napus]|uniref:BnaCnng22960D protein n=1 Tax=Brassica napus TaxID=3708 RepID=A0A078IRL9_BRANA|nr:BnaCnng22960D [Brassica napus]
MPNVTSGFKKIHHADASSIIRYLPGFEGPLPFELETGYIGVSDAKEDQLFYYFIKSENNPKTDPLLVWLTGGPGCSSFSGLVYENGPLAFKVETYNGSIPSLVSTTYSWTKVTTISCISIFHLQVKHFLSVNMFYQKNMLSISCDTGSVKRVDEFIPKHPEYSSNPFYVTGNSYSGKVIPAIVQEMSKGKCFSFCFVFLLQQQGYVLGNPVTDFDLDNNTRVPFAHGMALISDELYESMKISCGENLTLIEEFKQSVSRIYDELVLDTNCDTTSPDCYTYRYLLSEYWANNESVRRALGVVKRNGNVVIITCSANKTLKAAYHTILVTALQAIDLSSSAANDHDMSIPFVSSRAWIKSLNYSVIDKWRPWMILDKVAGYTTTYANKMTFATVKENTIMFKRCFVITLKNSRKRMGSWILKSLLLKLLVVSIQNHADGGSIVRYLPGFEGPLPFQIETGYIGVGEGEEDQLFYYFIKSERNPEEDPLLVWLAGGPGCSSFSGLVYENGPLGFKVETYNGSIPSLVSTTYSWTKVANIIYLDQPVGTGFSYSRNQLSDTPSDTEAAKRVNEFLRKWLVKHPEYFSNPLYVAGNSYSGIVIPAIVQEISNVNHLITGNDICCEPQINLKGYLLGNPLTDSVLDRNARIPFAHGKALISDELYDSMKRCCGGNYFNVFPLNTECLKLVEEFKQCVFRIYEELILASNCDPKSPDCYSLNKPLENNTYRYSLSEYWANNESVRRALKVVKGTTGKWKRCDYNMRCPHDIISSIPYHVNNSIKGYRSLIFSGDHDMTIPYVATQAWIRSLNYSITEKWRPWMILDKVAGYTKTYANKMTFATVKGGGHTLEYKPEENSIMFKRWISGQPL